MKLISKNMSMKKATLKYGMMAIFLFHFQLISKAQLIVDTSYTVQDLIQNVLVGSGVYASNITYNGKAIAIGYFNGQNTNLGIDSGIVLSSGDVTKIPGAASNFISTSNNTNGDMDLESLISGSANQSEDASVIEFDFYTFSNTVKFKYVFGSEEYPNYVCTSFNDVFGFFISGPGIVGKENIALIPGTTTPVAISTVNGGGTTCPSNSTYYVDNAAQMGATISYNGLTTVLEASHSIQPCQVYHIKLAIADVGDGSYDSGVFLEAQSFNSSVNIQSKPTVQTPLPDSSLYEGCGYSSLDIVKTDSTSTISTLYLDYSGNAVNGVDYVTLPDSITFLPGQDTVTILLVPIADSLTEGTDTVEITVNGGSCATALGKIILTILDHPNIVLSLSNDTTIQCPTDSILRTSTVSGGVGYISYKWETGDTTTSIYAPADKSNVYNLIVTDICGFQVEDSTAVNVASYADLSVSLPNDTNICSYGSAWIKAVASGGKPQYSFAWEGLSNTEDSVLSSPDSIQTFIVFVTDSCGISASDTVNVTTLTFIPSFVYNFESNFEVSFNNVSPNSTILLWDFGTGDSAFTENPMYTYPEPGEYTVQMIVQNQLGCLDTLEQLIVVNPEFNAFIPNSFSPNEDGLNDTFGAKLTLEGDYHMQIYDRWGKLVYQSDDINNSWAGENLNGSKCSGGVYVYSFQFLDIYGDIHTRTGTVSLMR